MIRNGNCKIVLTVLLGMLWAAPALALPMANLALVNTPAAVGDAFQVEVWADADGIALELLTFGFDLSFAQGDVFQYLGYEIESGFDDFSMGEENVTGDVFPGIADDDVLLATLSFTTLALGIDTLHILGLYDGEFSGLYYETPDFDLTGYDIDASLTIETGTPIPEPASWLLILAGITGLVRLNRNCRRHKQI